MLRDDRGRRDGVGEEVQEETDGAHGGAQRVLRRRWASRSSARPGSPRSAAPT